VPKENKSRLNLPKVSPIEADKVKLPYNGSVVSEQGFSFSFACFDHSHELFNLGGKTEDGTVGGSWFIDLMDCLKSVSNMTFDQARASMHELHPVDWKNANVKCPTNDKQHEYWQFRINKSKGRVVGILIDSVFYVVWLDRHHNLSNSEGYGGAKKFSPGKSLYELQEERIQELESKCKQLQADVDELLSK